MHGRFQVVKMERNGPTWSQKDTKREPKATKMEPKAPTSIFYAEKRHQKAISMHPKIDIQKRSAPGRSAHFGAGTPGRLFCRFMLKKDGFWEPFGVQNLIKLMKKPTQESTPEKFGKTMARRSKMLLFRLTCCKI